MTQAFEYLPSVSGSRSAPPFAAELPEAAAQPEHPVFDVMDAQTKALLTGAGCYRHYRAGESIANPGDVMFVLEGIVGHIPPPLPVCVAISGVGSVLGLECAVIRPRATALVALVDTRAFQAPIETLIEGLGRDKVQELCIRQSQAHLAAMETEAACNAAHLVPPRLAKWVLRLHLANHQRDVRLTQAQLAHLMGVQRTSVNIAARQLQALGAARFVRGKVIVQNLGALAHSACGCAG